MRSIRRTGSRNPRPGSKRERLGAPRILCGAVLLSLSAARAEAQAERPASSAAPELLVTGSRIPAQTLNSVSPVIAVDRRERELQGATSVAALLDSLPPVNAGASIGGASVDLRGLGAARTKVLIDGRPMTPAPDLDVVPAALVKRIDVLTGGASAVYGDGALAGAVNLIMDRDFQGVRVDAQSSFGRRHGDAQDVSLMFGAAPRGRGNVTGYLGYRHANPGPRSPTGGLMPQDGLPHSDVRYSGGYFARYGIADALELYSEAMFAEDRAVFRTAPAGLSQNLGPPLRDDQRRTDARLLVGARGDLGDAWKYDVYLQYGREAFKARRRDSPAWGALSGRTAESVFSALLSGDLGQYGFRFPLSTDGIGVALGADYVRDSLRLRGDQEAVAGDLSGPWAPTGVAGGYGVHELFGEVRAPILQDLPYARDLTLEAGYRFSDYSTVGVANAYKIGFDYVPASDIKVRAAYNRAVRAPSVTELFTPTVLAMFGVAPAQSPPCPAAPCSALVGGDRSLRAEISRSFTAGVSLHPHWLAGLDVSFDYFDIRVANAISSLPAAILADCLVNGDAAACGAVQGDPVGSQVFGPGGFIDAVDVDAGFLKTTGVDVQAGYRMRLADFGLGERGGLALSFLGAWTDSYVVQPSAGGQAFDCAGLVGGACRAVAAGGPAPQWRHKLRVTWTTPWPVTLSLDWRRLSRIDLDISPLDPLLGDPPRAGTAEAIPAFDYIDLSGLWKAGERLTLRAGVDNLFDKAPPRLGLDAGAATSLPGAYDFLGRVIFVGLAADF